MTLTPSSKFTLKVILGVTIFSVLIWNSGVHTIWTQLLLIKFSAVIIYGLLNVVAYLLAGLGIIILGSSLNKKVFCQQGLRGFLATASLALFTPGRAGDLLLPLYWKRYLSYGETMAVVFVDKIITLFWLISIGSSGVYIIFGLQYGLIVGALLLIGLGACSMLILSRSCRTIIIRIIPKKLMAIFSGFIPAFQTVLKSGHTFITITVVITGIRIVLYAYGFCVLLDGLGSSCSLVYATLILALAQLTSIVPISIMGLGVVESIFILGFTQLNIASSQIIAVSLIGRIVTVFWLSIFFSFFTIENKNKLTAKK